MTRHAAPQAGAPLAEWLAWMERIDPTHIELGLDRVRAAAERLGVAQQSVPVITVAGTNGKGSTTALIDAIATAHGVRVGAFLSPHIHRFNERIRIGGDDVGDSHLIAAFGAVADASDRAPEIALTYFEIALLAALVVFARAQVELVVLEIGLGGRLDAANVIDADVAIVTSIGLDHTDWLGDTVDKIAAEKAGIARQGRFCVLGAAKMPQGLHDALAAIGAREVPHTPRLEATSGAAHGWSRIDHGDAHPGQQSEGGVREHWAQWSRCVDGRVIRHTALPLPALAGSVQLDNASAAMTALRLTDHPALGVSLQTSRIARGLQAVRLPGRFQTIRPADRDWPRVIVDTGHNAEAAEVLAASIAELGLPPHRVACVLGMYADKPADAFARALHAVVGDWFCVGLPGPRGQSAEALAAQIQPVLGTRVACRSNMVEALAAAAILEGGHGAHPADQAEHDPGVVICCGSFATVALAMNAVDAGAKPQQ